MEETESAIILKQRLQEHLPFLRQVLRNFNPADEQFKNIKLVLDVIEKPKKYRYSLLKKCENLMLFLQSNTKHLSDKEEACDTASNPADPDAIVPRPYDDSNSLTSTCSSSEIESNTDPNTRIVAAKHQAIEFTPPNEDFYDFYSASPSETCSYDIAEIYKNDEPNIYATTVKVLESVSAESNFTANFADKKVYKMGTSVQSNLVDFLESHQANIAGVLGEKSPVNFDDVSVCPELMQEKVLKCTKPTNASVNQDRKSIEQVQSKTSTDNNNTSAGGKQFKSTNSHARLYELLSDKKKVRRSTRDHYDSKMVSDGDGSIDKHPNDSKETLEPEHHTLSELSPVEEPQSRLNQPIAIPGERIRAALPHPDSAWEQNHEHLHEFDQKTLDYMLEAPKVLNSYVMLWPELNEKLEVLAAPSVIEPDPIAETERGNEALGDENGTQVPKPRSETKIVEKPSTSEANCDISKLESRSGVDCNSLRKMIRQAKNDMNSDGGVFFPAHLIELMDQFLQEKVSPSEPIGVPNLQSVSKPECVTRSKYQELVSKGKYVEAMKRIRKRRMVKHFEFLQGTVDEQEKNDHTEIDMSGKIAKVEKVGKVQNLKKSNEENKGFVVVNNIDRIIDAVARNSLVNGKAVDIDTPEEIFSEKLQDKDVNVENKDLNKRPKNLEQTPADNLSVASRCKSTIRAIRRSSPLTTTSEVCPKKHLDPEVHSGPCAGELFNITKELRVVLQKLPDFEGGTVSSKEVVKKWDKLDNLKNTKRAEEELDSALQKFVDEVPDLLPSNIPESKKRKILQMPLSTTKPKKRKTDTQPVADFVPAAVEPDKGYYLKCLTSDNHCKLCDFTGAAIVMHYIHEHPGSEVLISRLSPEAAEEALHESVLNGYECSKAQDVCKNYKSDRFDFRCRFCMHLFRKESTAEFFDHVSSHTGECRYHCLHCGFKHYFRTTVKSHMIHEHNMFVEPRNGKPPKNDGKLFGYMCSECNYLQLCKESIEIHISVFHANNNCAHVYTINMSSLPILPKSRRKQVFTEHNNFATDCVGCMNEHKLEIRNRHKKEISIIKSIFKKLIEKANINNTVIHLNLPSEMLKYKVTDVSSPQSSTFKTKLNESTFKKKILNSAKGPITKIPAEARKNIATQPPNDTEQIILPGGILEKERASSPKRASNSATTPFPDAANYLSPSNVLAKLMTVSFLNACIYQDKSVVYIYTMPHLEFKSAARKSFEESILRFEQDGERLKCNVCDKTSVMRMHLLHLFAHLCEHVDEYLAQEQPDMEIIEIKDDDDADWGKCSASNSCQIDEHKSLAKTMIGSPPSTTIVKPISNSVWTICKMSAMTSDDLKKELKHPDVIRKWLNSQIAHLFKCPQFECAFVTESEDEFDEHFLIHDFSDDLIPCLYCKYKMRQEFYKMHLMMTHVKCNYGCGYCLYRAKKVAYVKLHHLSCHPLKVVEIRPLVRPKSRHLYHTPALPQINTILQPYTCVCTLQFYCTSNFQMHQVKCSHCVVNVELPSTFYEKNCRYCQFGAKTTIEMVKHIAILHPHHSLSIVLRQHKDQIVTEYERPDVCDNLIILGDDFLSGILANYLSGRKIKDQLSTLNPKKQDIHFENFNGNSNSM